MREKVEEYEENKVEVRREDRTIRDFTIPIQADLSGEILKISSVTVIKNHEPTNKKVNVILRKNQHLLLTGPNGIGKSTLLEKLAQSQNSTPSPAGKIPGSAGKKSKTAKTEQGATIAPDVRIGYYRQDFSTLNFEHTVHQTLQDALKSSGDEVLEETLRSVAAGFLITKDFIYSKVGTLSEGQKGLVAFASLVLQKPGLLILDEPTNHINFRHLPVIAAALDQYAGAMILVSHAPEFVARIRIDEFLNL